MEPSTSCWPGDLEIDDVKSNVADRQRQTDTDYVNVTAGVHHAFIHTPMWYEPGWERGYARAIREVSKTPVLLVGRITTPEVAEELLEAGDGDAICLARQLFADPEWANKAAEGRPEDIRRCVAANYCWRTAATGRRVQCIYNPEMGREGKWGSGTLTPVASPRKVLVIGGGPSGLEYARVASARGHVVTLLEGNTATGGHVRVQSLLPTRSEYGQIATWLAAQATKNGAEIRTGTHVTPDGLGALVASERPDHVVVATGSKACRNGFQGWTGDALPGWERAQCVPWDEVAEGIVEPGGNVVVLDDLCDVIAPLTAVGLAGKGCKVSLVTRWPMVGMETILDVYLDWLLPSLYEANVEIIVDHFVEEITPTSVKIFNVHHEQSKRELPADWLVLATARQSSNELAEPLERSGVSFEVIGDAIAPRGTYEAVFEGHRAGRKL